jgi:hypothetical protein
MTGSSIGLETFIARKAGLPETAVDDDLVIFNVAAQNYVGLDDIGRAVWEFLAEPRRVDEICQAMAARYDGPPDVICGDVMAFLGDLADQELIVIDP